MSTDEKLSRELSGRYRLGPKIGAGGMGTLYEGVQLGLDRQVAIKLIKPAAAASEESVERFRLEAKAIAKLAHPNIVAIHDFDSTQEGHLYLVMELIRGESVRQRMRRGPVAPDEARRIVEGVARALQHAHAAQIVHRDIKPENVMVNEDGQVKVLDFGIARMLDGEKGVTETGIVVGTAGYVAPEMIHLGEIDARGDLYAVGMLWVEMLLGRFPFEAENPMALMLRAANTDLPPLSTLGIDVDERDGQLIHALTQRDRERRLQSAADLVSALEGEPFAQTMSAAPPTMTDVPQEQNPTPTPATNTAISLDQHTMLTAELARKNRSTSIIAGAALAVAVAAIGFMAWVVLDKKDDVAPMPTPNTLAAATPETIKDMPVAMEVKESVKETAAVEKSVENASSEGAVKEDAAEKDGVEKDSVVEKKKVKKRRRRRAKNGAVAKAAGEVEAPAAKKGPTSKDIKKALLASFGSARSCKNTNLKARSGGGILVDHCPSYDTVAGKQWVKITIAPDGQITDARYSKRSVGDAKIAACALESIKRWKFPAFNGEEPITISQPIAFEQCVPINGRCVY